jgi:hypothetical protein
MEKILTKYKRRNYYYEKNIDKAIIAAERRVEELKVIRELVHLDDKLRMLKSFNIIKKGV